MLTSSPSACQPTACQPLCPSCVDATTCVPTALFLSHVVERGPGAYSLSWRRYVGVDGSISSNDGGSSVNGTLLVVENSNSYSTLR